jgi:hypothetical protein
MNYKKACTQLEIDSDEDITPEIVKRQYRILALKYHPDKNQEPGSVSKFQEIQESYEFLRKHTDHSSNYHSYNDSYYDNSDSDNSTDTEDDVRSRTNYKTILFSFLKHILIPEKRNKLFYTILKQVTSTCEANSLELLNKLEKDNLIKVCEIITMNKDILHFSEEFIEEIKDMIQEKVKNDERIVLNPTLDDLFENNLYQLKINGFKYIVPLWHNELVYDNLGNDIYVKCIPILPNNIEIDEQNNIHVRQTYSIRDIWEKECLTIFVGKSRFYILRDTLKLQKEQSFTFIKQGISRINTKNIYDIENKSDVTITITLDV